MTGGGGYGIILATYGIIGRRWQMADGTGARAKGELEIGNCKFEIGEDETQRKGSFLTG
jgi:hypothetical protein